MNTDQLKNAAKLFERLQQLDQQIEKLSGFARKIKDRNLQLNITLSYEKPVTISFDGDGSLLTGGMHRPRYSFLGGILGGEYSNPTPPKEEHNDSIDEVVSLQVLGVILSHREAERMYIIQQLRHIGITIEESPIKQQK